jgi:imidazolonepropionase
VSSLPGLLVHNAAEVATLAGGVRRGSAQAHIGFVEGVDAVAAYEGRVVAVGQLDVVERQLDGLGVARESVERLDARRGTVTPGLVDPHTHLLFAGTRQAEVELRQHGHTYLEILAAGGGILQTVRETRAASDDDLLARARRWLAEMLGHGVTTVEVKSGYGLSTDAELRLLRLAGQLRDEGPLDIVPTFLGAHAVAPEFRTPDEPSRGAAKYMANVIEQQLPRVADQGIATSCDVFCERGVFGVDQSRKLLMRAQELGLNARLHADQLTATGGAELAAQIGALSADHLGGITEEGIAALGAAADSGQATVATLLPISAFYLDEPHFAPARALLDRGVPVAVGTDFNPGTSPAPNAQLALSFAVHRLKLTAAEALAAMTINAAATLGLAETHGSLEPGKHADLVVWDADSYTLLPYWLGANLVRTVVKKGRVVYEASAA